MTFDLERQSVEVAKNLVSHIVYTVLTSRAGTNSKNTRDFF